MKKTQFVKFSLTLVSAAVLAACSSGGSKTVAPKPEAAKPEAAKPQTLVEKYGLDHKKTFGNQFIKKQQSDLRVDADRAVETNNKSSLEALDMTLALHPSLDTIVVAENTTKDQNGKVIKEIVYLEDFDFRDTDPTTFEAGVHTLNNIHVIANGKTKPATVSAARTGFAATAAAATEAAPFESETKTNLMGKEKGRALVLIDNDTANYVERSIKDAKAQKEANKVASVAEVYGDRTFLAENPAAGSVPKQAKPPVANVAKNNAPLIKADDTAGKLSYVQYGRVTSRLHNVSEGGLGANLRSGVTGNEKVTYIGSFGVFGSEATEDHYFYRTALEARPKLDVEALKKANQVSDTEVAKDRAVLSYRGHAVTYGLDHRYHKPRANGLPNAIGAETDKIVSGTHVSAKVNLDTKEVKGVIYDKWKLNGEKEIQTNPLVDFEGTLDVNNGAIKGRSELAYETSNKGNFYANLFDGTTPSNATELGGAVKSDAQTDKDWGAVFGVKQYVDVLKVEAGAGKTEKQGLDFTTDERSSLIGN